MRVQRDYYYPFRPTLSGKHMESGTLEPKQEAGVIKDFERCPGKCHGRQSTSQNSPSGQQG